MPTSDEREPADVEVDDDADVIVRPGRSGHGSNRRFHRPHRFYGNKPACEVRHQYNDGKWDRKQRRVVGDQKSPCKKCYQDKDAPKQGSRSHSNEKPCPLCGETVTSVAIHLKHDCEENND